MSHTHKNSHTTNDFAIFFRKSDLKGINSYFRIDL